MSQHIAVSSTTPTTPTPASKPFSVGGRRPQYALSPNAGQAGATPVIIQLGSSFEGWLICREAARIDGQFRGHLVAEGRIELGRSSDVTGRIEAQDILVEGRFEGQLIARHSISLLATARVKGALHTRELAAEEGCTVSGRCHTPD